MTARDSILRLAAASVLLAAQSVVLAQSDPSTTQPATTQPAPTQTDNGRPMRDANGPAGRLGFRNRLRPSGDRPATPSDTDWDRVVTFMQQHSPRRLKEFEDMPTAQPARKNLLKQIIATRFASIDGLRQSDPKMYDLQVNKIETEDAIFGMLRDHPHDSMSDGDRADFKQLVGSLVKANLDERQQRIDSAADSLDKAKASLAHDRDQQDKLINQRAADLIKSGMKPLKMQGDDDEDRPAKPKPGGAAKDGAAD